MEILHFGTWGYPLLLMPTARGRFFEPENHGIIEKLRGHLDNGYVQIFCLDTLDSDTFFAKGLSLTARRDRWLALEQHWTDEFIPFARHEAQNDFLVVAGFSLGATHALNLALRHPGLVHRCIAIAGTYDLAHTPSLFGEFHPLEKEQSLYFISPMAYMSNMSLSRWRELGGAILDIKLLVGRTDPALEDNIRFADILRRVGIPHHLEIWEGGHHWETWGQQLLAFA